MKKHWVCGFLAGLVWLSGASVSAQSVKGSRETTKTFFRADEEMEFTLKLVNSGTEGKAVTVQEAVPEGWTVLNVSNEGKIGPPGTIPSAIDQNFFTVFNPNPHVEDFNHVTTFWSNQAGGGYPYAGKSTVGRGDDTNEYDAPEPMGVFDLQLHPPNNPHLTVAALVVPIAGDYTISNLAVRRVFSSGATVVFLVFDAGKNSLAALTAANDQFWITDTESYTIKNLQVKDRIYFAVSYDGDYGWDATEVIFTVKTGSTVWHSYNTVIAAGSPQATIPDDTGKVKADLEFYESEYDNGVEPNDPAGFSAKGNILTWNLTVPPGTMSLTYTAKAPEAPKGGAPIWFGTCDGYAIRGINTLSVVNKSALVKGIRRATQPYYRSGEEIEFSIELVNSGTDPKSITVMDALPEGWTVSSAGNGGTIANGGVISPIDQGLFTKFTTGLHNEGFNNLKEFWSNQAGGGYPYAGKSAVPRGKDSNETNTPPPLDVSDLQLHPPNNDHLTVAAFNVPTAGTYTLSDLAVRRVFNSGATVVYMVFDAEKNQIASLTASNDQVWVTDTNSYSLGNLKVGDRIYFAVSRDGDYGWDATEVVFALKTGPTVWHSYDILTTEGFPQAVIVDEAGKTEARVDFYESTDDNGLEQNIVSTTAKGSVITWKPSVPSGTSVLTYKAKPPATPNYTDTWFGVSDGIGIVGLNVIHQLLPAVGIFDGHLDIGAVAAAGDAVYPAIVQEYDVTGSGGDIWGIADAFHFLYKELKGDFTLKAVIQIDPLNSTSGWIKAGLLARDDLYPGAAFYDAVLRTDLQATSQWRLLADSDSAYTNNMLTLDVQAGELEINRVGNTFSTYYLNIVDGQRTLYDARPIEMSDPIYVGLAVAANDNGHLAKGIFTNLDLIMNTNVENWSLY